MKSTTSRGKPKANEQFSHTPAAYRSEVFETKDNTNRSRDHAASAADYHHFSGVGGEAHAFRGAGPDQETGFPRGTPSVFADVLTG